MSLKAMIWAWDQQVGSAIRKMILLKLADNTNEESGLCFPKQETIAQYCECDRRTVNRNMKILEEMELLKVIHQYRDGKQIENKYKLNLGNSSRFRGGTGSQQVRSCVHLGGAQDLTESVSLTSKSIKGKKPKNSIISLEKKPTWLPEKTITDFVEHRKQIKKPLTQIGLERLFAKLNTIRQQGGDPIESINNSILSGYQGVFLVRKDYGKNKSTTGYEQTQAANAYAMQKLRELDEQELGESLPQTLGDTPNPLQPTGICNQDGFD